jgi:hypothetical protein
MFAFVVLLFGIGNAIAQQPGFVLPSLHTKHCLLHPDQPTRLYGHLPFLSLSARRTPALGARPLTAVPLTTEMLPSGTADL